MKCLLFVAICLVVVLEITAKPPPPPRQRKCDDTGDCEPNECCIAHAVSPFFRKGECRKLAAEGNNCNHRDYSLQGKYLLHCPCQDGFECIPEEIKTLPLVGEVRINERCSVPPSTTVAPETEPDTESPEPETESPDTETVV